MDIVIFKHKRKEHIGFIIEPLDITMVVYFNGKSIIKDTLENVSIIHQYRHWIYTAETDLYEQQKALFKLAVTDSKNIMTKLLKTLNPKTNLSLVFVYMILANKISFPAQFTTDKITSKKLLDENFGFTEIRIH